MSIRGLKMLPRDISWEGLTAVRERLTPYRSRTKRLQAPPDSGCAARTAAVAPLAAILQTQAAILAAENRVPEDRPSGIARVIVCLDGTTMWKCTMTRCDVTLVAEPPVQHVRQIRQWSTWWVLDGGDHHRALQVLDGQMALNEQVSRRPPPTWCQWCQCFSRAV